jgi:hypothetical protein
MGGDVQPDRRSRGNVVLGLLPTGRTLPTEELSEATGPARGLVELVVDEVNQRIVHGWAVRRADAWTEVPSPIRT